MFKSQTQNLFFYNFFLLIKETYVHFTNVPLLLLHNQSWNDNRCNIRRNLTSLPIKTINQEQSVSKTFHFLLSYHYILYCSYIWQNHSKTHKSSNFLYWVRDEMETTILYQISWKYANTSNFRLFVIKINKQKILKSQDK